MALEKNRRAIPFVDEGRALKAAALKVAKATDLLNMKDIRPALLTASGLSAKALNYLEESDKADAISGLIEQFLDPSGDDFVDELVYRFLLIKDDSLGGKMRNVAGFLAQQIFKRAIISALSVRDLEYSWQSKSANKWIEGKFSSECTEDVDGIHWKNNGERVVIFNKTVPFIKKKHRYFFAGINPRKCSG